VWITREVSLRAALTAVGRMAVLGVPVSLWWIAGLWAEGSYGLAILQYTETVPTVATTALSSEVLRGLGYWFFYGQDKVQPWTQAAVAYTQALWLIALSFLAPVLALVAGALTRWRYRSFSLALVVVGTVVAVGPYPYEHPSPVGHLLKATANDSSIGLAMRSSNRVVPIVVLGLALLLGSGVSALAAARPRAGLLAAVLAGGVALADLQPLWTGGLVAANLSRPSALPPYWLAAASYLNAQPGDTRVLGLPGEDFAAYRWGVTEDPLPPGLLTRPYVARQVVPQGEPASVDLLAALDGSIQDGVFDPATLAPLARLMSAGQVLLQSDLQYERYSLPLPAALWHQLVPAPPGLARPVTFGHPAPTPVIRYPRIDETQLGLPAGTGYPPPLASFTVLDTRPIVRAESPDHALVVAGTGAGLVDAAAAGLLAGNPTVFYSGSYDHDPAGLSRVLAGGATLVLTDSDAKTARRWGTLQDVTGYVEQPGETALVPDPSDQPLPVIPDQAPDARTTARLNGVRSVRASAYGNPITYTPEDRPANAVDGNPATAWTVAAFSNAVGERIEIQPRAPVTTDHLVLLQAPGGNRHITRATVTFDHTHSMEVRMGPASLAGAGQVVEFPSRRFSTLDVTIDATTDDGGPHHSYDGLSGVGFSEIGIPGVDVHETIVMPGDLLRLAGASSLHNPLVVLMTRDRAPDVPPRHDPQLEIVRQFRLPVARTFTVGGTARISAGDPDPLIDALVGRSGSGTTAGDPIISARSSTRLPGDRSATAAAAVDHNPATAWTAAFGPQEGQTLTYTLARPLTFDHLDFQVVADGRHSVPTRMTVSAGGQSRTVTLPPLATGAGRPQGAVTAVPVAFPPLTGTAVQVRIDAVHPLTELDYYGGLSGARDVLPVALAELGLPGATMGAPPAAVPSPCRSDLVRVDSRPVAVAVVGSSRAALAGSGLSLVPCGASAAGIRLGPGPHLVETSPALPSGLEVDQLWLSSRAGGGPGPAAAPGPAGPPPPKVTVVHQDRTGYTLAVAGTRHGFWLVLGQSLSRGWTATLGDGTSLGPPRLIDGYANGWFVPPSRAKPTLTLHLTWAPQRVVWLALGLSAVGFLVALALAVAPRRRSSSALAAPEDGAVPDPPEWIGTRPDGPGPVTWRAALAAAALAGVVAGLVSSPLAALPVAVAALLGLRTRWGGLAVRAGAAAALAGAGGYVVVEQLLHRFLPNIEWPAQFGAANTLGWVAVVLVGTDALVTLLRDPVGHQTDH
jgi:arabinofuranan 3-O-arabinosyltransferase